MKRAAKRVDPVCEREAAHAVVSGAHRGSALAARRAGLGRALNRI
jgi:hypothetical protein